MLRERIENGSEKITESGCWIWMKSLWGDYPSIKVAGKSEKANRISFYAFKGRIPKGMCVLHTCDIPSCVNPGHLFLGTHQDNMRDMAMKHRAKGWPGEKNWNSKLTAVQAKEIIESSGIHAQIAKRYGVSRSTVTLIKQGKIWRQT